MSSHIHYTKKERTVRKIQIPTVVSLWCAWRDLNPHGLPLEPKLHERILI